MEFIFHHFWVIGFVVLVANAIFLHVRFKPRYEENPELKKGYQQIILWYSIIIFGAIVAFAIGDLVFRLDVRTLDKNPFKYVLFGYTIFWCILCIIWIHFLNGADFLEKHPGVMNVHYFGKYKEITDRFWLKFIFTVMSIGGITISVIRMLV